MPTMLLILAAVFEKNSVELLDPSRLSIRRSPRIF